MISGSRCVAHVPPRVLPKFVDPAKRRIWPVRATSLHRVAAPRFSRFDLPVARGRRLTGSRGTVQATSKRGQRPGSAQPRCTGLPNRPRDITRERA
jgi:hypothetical protein